MPSAPLPTCKQTVKKVPTGRHARTVGTHTGKLSAESVRAALRRVRGSALNFVPRGIPGGRNFCPAYAGRNGFPLERVAKATRKKPPRFTPQGFRLREAGIYLFSQAVSSQLSSAQVSLTSVFGMGTGGASPSSTPAVRNISISLRCCFPGRLSILF